MQVVASNITTSDNPAAMTINPKPQTTLNRLYLGWITEPSRTAYLAEPQAPGNYKDEEKIKEYVAKAKHKQLVEASDTPGIATLREWCIFDRDGKSVTCHRGAGAARALYDFLGDHHAAWEWNNPEHPQHQSGLAEPWLYGFGIEVAMRVMAFDLLAAGVSPKGPFMSLARIVRNVPRMWCDPYQWMCTEDTRKALGLAGFLKIVAGWDPANRWTPEDQAAVARNVAIRMGVGW